MLHDFKNVNRIMCTILRVLWKRHHVIGDNSEDSCLNWFSSLSYMFTEQRESLRHSRRHSIRSAKNNSFCNRGTGSLTCLLARSLLHRTRRDARKKAAKEARGKKTSVSNMRDVKSVSKVHALRPSMRVRW